MRRVFVNIIFIEKEKAMIGQSLGALHLDALGLALLNCVKEVAWTELDTWQLISSSLNPPRSRSSHNHPASPSAMARPDTLYKGSYTLGTSLTRLV